MKGFFSSSKRDSSHGRAYATQPAAATGSSEDELQALSLLCFQLKVHKVSWHVV